MGDGGCGNLVPSAFSLVKGPGNEVEAAGDGLLFK